MPEAARTLVKSPPELWAEVSDPESLARHLGAFGEIRITRLEPENTVAWEGDRMRGTVDLAPAGWGTKVTVTAEEIEDAAAAEPPAEPDDEPAQPQTAQEPEAAAAPEPESTAEPAPEPPGDARPAELGAASPRAGLRGLWGRIFGRREATGPAAGPEPEAVAAPAAEAEPAAVAVAEPEPEPEAVAVAEPAPVSASRPDPAAVLDGMLGSLGAAHHRPFSR
jgi:hypothetical protein